MLESVRDLGVDIIYLCSLCEADDDGDERFLSKRQILSKTGNPKNPYRVKYYFKIDEEYGTDDDLRDFVRKAHALGMKVLLDLVYYHCGPKAVIMDMDKEFINWRNALTSYGMRRRRIIKELVFLRKSTPELYDGTTRWLDNSEYDRVFSFLRGENILVVVNAAPESVTVKINTHCGTPLMKKDTFYLEENGKLKLSMSAHGYIIMRL